MSLLDFQFSLAGTVMGDGTPYLGRIVGGLGLGPKRSKVFQIAGADGIEFGREYRDGKTISFEGEIAADTSADAWALVLELETLWDGAGRTSPRTTMELRVKFPGQAERVILGRPNLFDYDVVRSGLGLIPWSATFDAVTR